MENEIKASCPANMHLFEKANPFTLDENVYLMLNCFSIFPDTTGWGKKEAGNWCKKKKGKTETTKINFVHLRNLCTVRAAATQVTEYWVKTPNSIHAILLFSFYINISIANIISQLYFFPVNIFPVNLVHTHILNSLLHLLWVSAQGIPCLNAHIVPV